jgi:hypothetical protein
MRNHRILSYLYRYTYFNPDKIIMKYDFVQAIRDDTFYTFVVSRFY